MAKLRMQYKSGSGSTLGVILSILRSEGFTGLFAGLQPQLLKSVLSGALLMMFKEGISAQIDLFLAFILRLFSRRQKQE